MLVRRHALGPTIFVPCLWLAQRGNWSLRNFCLWSEFLGLSSKIFDCVLPIVSIGPNTVEGLLIPLALQD